MRIAFRSQLTDSRPAYSRSDMKSVSLALAHASQEDVNAPISPRDARTPLHLATSLGSLPIVQLLIWVSSRVGGAAYCRSGRRLHSLPIFQSNANVKSVDHDGRTCISYARNCSNGAVGSGGSGGSVNQELVELLLNNGCPEGGRWLHLATWADEDTLTDEDLEDWLERQTAVFAPCTQCPGQGQPAAACEP